MRYQRAASGRSLPPVLYKNVTHGSHVTGALLVGYDPLARLVRDLEVRLRRTSLCCSREQDRFGDLALFFYNSHCSRRDTCAIGLVWNPAAVQPQAKLSLQRIVHVEPRSDAGKTTLHVNLNAALAEMRQLGAGLVESVEVLRGATA